MTTRETTVTLTCDICGKTIIDKGFGIPYKIRFWDSNSSAEISFDSCDQCFLPFAVQFALPFGQKESV